MHKINTEKYISETIENYKNKKIIFIVGFQRSGTSWLQKMLGGHPNIGTSQESHVFSHFLGHAIRTWDFVLENEVRQVGLPAYLTCQEFDDLLRFNFYCILSASDEFINNDFFVEKTPDHVFSIPYILRLFPNAKIIALTRNPYDVVESLVAASSSWGAHWAPKNTLIGARHWNKYAKSLIKQLDLLDDEKILRVKYEELYEDTYSGLEKILSFLNVESNPFDVEVMLNSSYENLKIYGEFSKNKNNMSIEPEGFTRKVKGHLNIFKRMMISSLCGKLATKLGY